MNVRKSLSALALCAVLGGWLGGPAMRADAHAGDEPRRVVNATAPVSLSYGETLRVNFTNLGRSPFEIIPCVFDGDGAHLKTGDVLTLAPGETRSFDVSRAEAGRLGDGSVRVRAGVHADEPDLKGLVASGEVVEDATGRTAVFVPGLLSASDGVRAGALPKSLAPVGVADGQLLRVNLVNAGASAFEVTPTVYGCDGSVRTAGAPLRLAPGQTASFETERVAAAARTGPCRTLRGAALVRGADAKNLLISGEVFEASGGRGTLFVPAARVGFDPQPDPPTPAPETDAR